MYFRYEAIKRMHLCSNFNYFTWGVKWCNWKLLSLISVISLLLRAFCPRLDTNAAAAAAAATSTIGGNKLFDAAGVLLFAEFASDVIAFAI